MLARAKKVRENLILPAGRSTTINRRVSTSGWRPQDLSCPCLIPQSRPADANFTSARIQPHHFRPRDQRRQPLAG
jgi:hypothetical protein